MKENAFVTISVLRKTRFKLKKVKDDLEQKLERNITWDYFLLCFADHYLNRKK